MTQADPVFGQSHDRQKIAEVTGIRSKTLTRRFYPTVSTGVLHRPGPFATWTRFAGCRSNQQRSSEYLAAAAEVFLLRFSSNRLIPLPAYMRACYFTMARSRYRLSFRLCRGLDGRARRGLNRPTGDDRASIEMNGPAEFLSVLATQ